MVKYETPDLTRTFAALADPSRRAIISRLGAAHSLTVSELADPLPMSLPAVMKHLDVLSDAGLITRSKSGRTVACRLNATPMQDAMSWLARYEQFWSEGLDRLIDFVESAEPSPARTEEKP
ncbi:MAG: ArsR/SmtB family transcription factor [Caulobacterales bacterium]